MNNAIFLTDSAEKIRKKIKGALSDKRGGNNLINLLEQFSDNRKLFLKFKNEYKKGTIKYSELKPRLAESIIKRLKPIQKKRKYYESNPEIVEKVLKEGTEKARKVASETLKLVKKKMKIDYL